MKKVTILATILVIGLSFVAAQEQPGNVGNLQQILKATNASWTAAETTISRMSVSERKQLLGLLPGVFNPATVPAPIVVSFQPVRGGYETPHTPVRDQGQCGSCYSFGACGTYEGWRLLNGVATDLSEQYFMMKAKEIGPYGGCSGWWLDTSMNLLRDNGVADESACSYLAYESACPSSATPVHRIGSYVATTDQATIQSALHNYGPVYVGFAVYNDFFSYSGGYYEYSSGGLAGYHAVCIVGYDDTGFKVKNSWGTGWGESGYFRIKYSQMTNSVQFGTCFGGSFYITD